MTHRNLGWVILFKTADLNNQILQIMGERTISQLSSGQLEEIRGLTLNFFEKCMDRLEKMLPQGCAIVPDQLTCIFGRHRIVGSDEACLKLKEKVEADGFAEMRRNVGII